jgi:hypothetical protein
VIRVTDVRDGTHSLLYKAGFGAGGTRPGVHGPNNHLNASFENLCDPQKYGG